MDTSSVGVRGPRCTLGADGIARAVRTCRAVPIGAPSTELKVFRARRQYSAPHHAFPNGGVFETRDNDAIDEALEALRAARRTTGAGCTGSKADGLWCSAPSSAVVLLSVAFLRWGVPAIANLVAHGSCRRTSDRAIGIGKRSTSSIARSSSPVELPAERRARLQLRARLHAMTSAARRWPRVPARVPAIRRAIGANAFALPSGIVVMTDELVEARRRTTMSSSPCSPMKSATCADGMRCGSCCRPPGFRRSPWRCSATSARSPAS